jgi:hypothetical protein
MELEKAKQLINLELKKKHTEQATTELMQQLDEFADVIVAYILKENYDNEHE